MHTIFHIDVNSAYLSWSALDKLKKGSDIDLRNIPSIIGGSTENRHGIVLAKSIPAKKYHIHTGEPVVSALRKCPNLVIEPPDHESYAQYSKQLIRFLYHICPEIEQVSIDECYMDYTPISAYYASPLAAANEIREKVLDNFGFTVNIGISDKKVLAKMASDFKKPNLVHTLFSNEIQEKLWPLPISALYMCGDSSVQALKKLEIRTIGALAKADPAIIHAHLKSQGQLLWEYANGIDDTPVAVQTSKHKGIGNSVTLGKDIIAAQDAYKVLLSLSETVSARLRKANQAASMVSVEIKYYNFQAVSHQTTLQSPTNRNDSLYETACRLFDEIWDKTPIRLLGIRTSKLQSASAPRQISLFDLEKSEKQQKIDVLMDEIRKKYGNNAVTRASLLSPPDTPHKK